jgi:DNA-binding NarL/FixJ family response regulator
VRGVASGREALAAAAHGQVALVVLEVRLGDVSGYEVCRQLREDHGESLPILFVSSDGTEASDRVAGLLVGADDYLAKPVVTDELVARARRHLRRLETWNGAGVRLTVREREVLGLLADGLGPAEIGAKLGITSKTVATHVGGKRASRTHWPGGSRAVIRASHSPQKATRPKRHCVRVSV